MVGGGRGQEEELEEEDEMAELEQRLRAAKLPEHALKAAKKELKVKLLLMSRRQRYWYNRLT